MLFNGVFFMNEKSCNISPHLHFEKKIPQNGENILLQKCSQFDFLKQFLNPFLNICMWSSLHIFFISLISICRCQFPSGALTGNLNVDHAMCVLSLNIINDKIFLLEWIWFYVLALASSFSLISTAILVILPPSRKLWIR